MMYSYGHRFYDINTSLYAPSASKIITALLMVKPIASVLDVGCARGAWLREWAKAGINDFCGIDGFDADDGRLMIDQACFTRADLAAGFDLRRQFDLVQSLEVAEHLPKHASASFIDALVRHSRGLIMFSAAPPGQGGEHHINEQSYDFWRSHFRAHDYHAVDWIRPQLVGDSKVSYWYRYNIILYVNEPMLARLPEHIIRCKVPDDKPITDISPPLFRVRKRIVRAMPQPVIVRLARVKTRLLLAVNQSNINENSI